MKIKTSELSGAQLDWAVAMCEGYAEGPSGSFWITEDDCVDFKPTTDWSQGGPIIERERIATEFLRWNPDDRQVGVWEAEHYEYGKSSKRHGPTPLIAAMRCYVASKLGEEVEVPDATT